MTCLVPTSLEVPPPLRARIAVDTEFHGPHTLSVQTAIRLDARRLAVQLYRSPLIPDLPGDFKLDAYATLTAQGYGRFCEQIILRPVKLLTPDLSPARMHADLCDVSGLNFLTRLSGVYLIEGFDDPQQPTSLPPNVKARERGDGWCIPEIQLTFIGHFLRADICRMFGREFISHLLPPDDHIGSRIVLRDRKVLQFVEGAGRRARTDPVLEYVLDGERLFAVRVQTRDTICPFGAASLDSLSRTFLGFGKCEQISQAEKGEMQGTFQRRPADAYGYAIVDALNTLLVYEQMQGKEAKIYDAFGVPAEEAPALRATVGSRVSTFLVTTTLGREGANQGTVFSKRTLESLMSVGGVALFKSAGDASRYGVQTGTTHGGLLYSRSATKFWHEAPGQLRDVDMAGCYNEVIGRLNVYWGRPVIFEPGSKGVTLKDAMAFVRQHADDDAWVIRATGPIEPYPNALMPSTENALTALNYRQKLGPGKRRQTRQRVFYLEALRDPGAVKGTRGSRLYSKVVESGVVTWPTWLMIQALPPAWRQAYESLNADSLIFYPRKLVAGNFTEFGVLMHRYCNAELPWEATLDLEQMELVRRDRIDNGFVTLRYPIQEYARQIGAFRKEAQRTEGKGSGLDHAWKIHANSMYGVLASSRLPTNNFVAANQVTAWARAEAYAMSQALNAIQTITDGCTYRLDQIPACTYAECLQHKPDYPIRRAEAGDGIPFIDPATIPQEDTAFTAWYRGHLQRFFAVATADHDRLFATHKLEHKKTGVSKAVAFDALACDGAGTYAKCSQDPQGGWHVEDFAARAYGRDSKQHLQGWLLQTYREDKLAELSPITLDHELLSLKKASQLARRALEAEIPEVYFPLGLELRRVLSYRVVKGSAFIFQTPAQRAAILKEIQKFEDANGAGLEMLTLRRGYRGRRRGSLADLAEVLYQQIQAGTTSLTAALNLYRMPKSLGALAEKRVMAIQEQKRVAQQGLWAAIDTRNIDPAALATGYLVQKADLSEVGALACAG
jgi:hypothetical protein